MDIFLIFPVHLFKNIDEIKNKTVYLIEEPRYFTDFKYHKLKLAYHRATLKSYYDYLLKNKINVTYFEFNDINDTFYKNIAKYNVTMYDPNDKILMEKILKNIPNINVKKSLNFLIDEKMIDKNKHLFYGTKFNFLNFYKWQRIKLNILMENDKPIGGRWTYDTENRKKLPKDIVIPKILQPNKNKYTKESIIYINNNFNNYGSLDNFIYPINHNDSKKWLMSFIKDKFENFGEYEDAESMKDQFLFHSVLTPIMNIGLLTDTEVLKIVLQYQDKIPIQSFEGFIRQIIGWRNYVYTIYLLTNIENTNFFNHTNKLNQEIMWKAETKILPIDNIINKIIDYSYCHHIERLMYLGNYMLLCMIDPKDVYTIFMEWTIDAYDWVMIPNVYGMSQFSCEDLMMKKPYFSSSNYVLKMSDYKKDNWCKIWDALYYNFINKHEKYLKTNYGTSRQVYHWNKKSDKEKKEILNIANKYLDSI